MPKEKMAKKINYEEIVIEAIEQECYAGFQNMPDIDKTIKFAIKEGYELQEKQEVRSLLLEKDERIWLMFFLKLKNESDIVVVHRGKVTTSAYGGRYLLTTPKKIIEWKWKR